MKLLLFSDVHLNEGRCKHLVALSKEVDIVVGAGDFCSTRCDLDKVIGWLSVITKPSVLVPGNAESYHELLVACESWPSSKVLHGNGVEINHVIFFGIGGGIPVTPFGSWSWDFTEDEAEILLSRCPHNAVLVSHSPPKGILDKSSMGLHLGSQAIKNTLRNKTPRLLVCGHIHESGGEKRKYKNTTVVNAGPDGVIYDL